MPGKRTKILDSALRIFAARGFFGAKVSDIASDAGVADGTIYLYFRSKDDLLIKIFEELMGDFLAALATATRDAERASEKLRRFVRAYLELVEKNPHAAEVLTVELRQSAKFMKEYANPKFAELLKLLAGLVGEGQASGELRADIPAPFAARALFGLLDEMAVLWVTSRGDKPDMRKTADWLADLVLQGMGAPPGPPPGRS